MQNYDERIETLPNALMFIVALEGFRNINIECNIIANNTGLA